jgi:queuine tRNA-ribosyltransferase
LVKSEEILGAMILSQVNLSYYQELVRGARDAIASGAFTDYAAQTRDGWARGDLPAN